MSTTTPKPGPKKTTAKKTSATKATTKKASAKKAPAKATAAKSGASKSGAPVRESRATWVVPVVGISVPVPAVPDVTVPKFDLPKLDLPKFELPQVSTVTEVPSHVVERAGDALGQARTFVDDARSSASRAVVLLREAIGV